MQPVIIVASGVVGLLVGMTGSGGGALITPLLVLGFGVAPTTAVASDLTATLGIRPVAAFVHARRGTVRWRLVGWLSAGSVPGAFLGAAAATRLGARHQHDLLVALGAVLLTGAAVTLRRSLVSPPAVGGVPGLAPVDLAQPGQSAPAAARGGWVLVLCGALAGMAVGATSTGSGSLLVVVLPILVPGLSMAEVVGTDLAQSVPLNAAAVVAVVLFGHVHWSLTASVLAGGMPGALVGARLAGRFADTSVRALVTLVVTAAGLRAVGAPVLALVAVAGAAAAVAATWPAVARRTA
jgi:uncharacterized membrane protein YfcA